MSKLQQITREFLSADLKRDGPQIYLKKTGGVDSKHAGTRIELKKYKFKVGALKDTSYKKKLDLLEEWEQFYLPDHMKMEVIGVLENFPCCADRAELVLMVCEDGNVFAYEDNRLHLVAENLKKLFDSGVQLPAKKSYYRGQCFGELTAAEWDQVKKSKEVVAHRKEHQKMLQSIKPGLMKSLTAIEQRRRAETRPGAKEKSEPPPAAVAAY